MNLHDLCLPYQKLSRELYPLTPTLPITLLNLKPIFGILTAFFSNLSDGDNLNSGLDSALSLVQALYATCLGEATPYLPITTQFLLHTSVLRALEPRLIEKCYSTLADILRQVAGTLLKSEELSSTWAQIHPYLRHSHKRYIRRCVADAWVAIIRKARGDGLRRLIGIMLAEDHEGMEAVWAHSIKGGPKQLHSRALPILEALLDRDVDLTLVVTSICHHCSSASLAPVVQILLDRSNLSLIGTLLFVRKGKRYPESLIKPTMQKLLDIPDMRATVAVLMASKLEHWLSPGVMLIEKAYSYELAMALVKLKWGGTEQFLLPTIAR